MAEDRNSARAEESEAERLDRELLELLNELRVAMPGVQVLFGFLLTVPFQQGFRRISETQEALYFVTLLLTATAGAFLIAPTAQHRLLFRERAKPHLIRLGTIEAIVGLAFLGAAMCCAVALITDLIFQSPTITAVVVPLGALYLWLWFGHGLVRRLRGKQSW